jgi:hypothetical protein
MAAADKCEEGKAEAEEKERRWLGNLDGEVIDGNPRSE